MAQLIDFDELNAVLTEYGEAVKQQYIDNLKRDGRPASGDLIQSITTRVVTGDREWVVEMSLKDYWKYIEYGTRGWYTGNTSRKFPPPSAILRWIQVKPVLPRPDAKGRIPSPKSLAYLIGRKIRDFGTRGRADLTEAKMSVTFDTNFSISLHPSPPRGAGYVDHTNKFSVHNCQASPRS